MIPSDASWVWKGVRIPFDAELVDLHEIQSRAYDAWVEAGMSLRAALDRKRDALVSGE